MFGGVMFGAFYFGQTVVDGTTPVTTPAVYWQLHRFEMKPTVGARA